MIDSLEQSVGMRCAERDDAREVVLPWLIWDPDRYTEAGPRAAESAARGATSSIREGSGFSEG